MQTYFVVVKYLKQFIQAMEINSPIIKLKERFKIIDINQVQFVVPK